MSERKIKITPKQKTALSALYAQQKKYVLYGGSAGGGKSFLGCLWLIERCYTNKGSRWLIGRSVLKTFKNTTLLTFIEVMEKMGLASDYKINNQQDYIAFKNGSIIFMRDLAYQPRDPYYTRLGSLEICGAFVDEANEISEYCFEIIKSRCRYKLDEFLIKGQILLSCNPSKGWLYNQFYVPHREGRESKNNLFIQSFAKDNIYLPADYLSTLDSLVGVMRERLLLGNWDYEDDNNALIPHQKALDYFTNEYVEKRGAMCITADIARMGGDRTVIRAWHGLVCLEVVVLQQAKLDEVIRVIKQLAIKYRVSMSNTVVDEDGVGGGVADSLHCIGFRNGSTPINRENYSNLKSQCYYLAANLINIGKMYEQDQRYKEEVLADMAWVRSWDNDGDGKLKVMPKEKIREKGGKSPDHWDSIMMRVYLLLIGGA